MPAPYRLMHAQYVKEYMQKREASPPGTVLPTKVLNHVRNLMAVDVTGEKFPISLRYEASLPPSACSVSVFGSLSRVCFYGAVIWHAALGALAVFIDLSSLLMISVWRHRTFSHSPINAA